ncbi:4-hydroxybenzoate polyprenyl transferase UbiA [Zymomonas mobilis subsp. mobilis ZM4 = ATCC 31821]|uniref:4-hydroxybenzoate octaprenyltransferase n=1 Tax=Zymomonas mobilis subsp. mobilis (strain ATCC 31821 / ZM4 / CP4) TaxID=264203 RepID=Q5NML7_ZYMMO|nr:4-hydroxybenzoate octaprenyltransferase [Zymomonas mobilis]AAV90043.1 4-hydroxybenzoate polyprenyl transferase [Zymomonas mobilis subsp. mobilis ZM4 = ATCC 31821]AVZ26270.1 4-hydroxybenzoate polyprenyl transferase UbiA [Zymomonas mobilis subsp. mobilis]AVZ28157.1 4-hydroxybenzoate polyprenyl transferase UbiA [Zymomonas mobilis subsp. mobilis]AVZ42602.1 4-hydroxybenzoate polyprenyl transferase UbiA [Zymomonas mobilis subsp. mobilis ZM4 = ATCC 31821]UBQ07369.1 4-hydroxybenzoate octaprenyltran
MVEQGNSVSTESDSRIVSDSEAKGIVKRLPPKLAAYISLARADRPIGVWLLFWPGAAAVALAGGLLSHWFLLPAFFIGAFVMRSAGCVYNDIVDRDLDKKVARTRNRPLASGFISVKAACLFIAFLCLIGLGCLTFFNPIARFTAIASLALVAAYPFMKRISWWPQAWLGLVFSWAALVGSVAIWDRFEWPGIFLYGGCIFWVIGFDTVYAIQDIEDDALAGIKSSARALKSHLRLGVSLFFVLAVLGWGAAIWFTRPQPLALLTLLPVVLHFIWQMTTLDVNDGQNALMRFRSNRQIGFLLFLACATIGMANNFSVY